MEPARYRYVLLKSRIHHRAAFGPIAGTIVDCDGEGVATSRPGAFADPPVHPLDG
jgi:microcystin degradation protein MlrC